jgi:hypothetical protein
MCRVKRLLCAAAIAAIALSPITAAAAATPSPSPSLDSILAKPPGSDYAELTTGTLHGEFTAHDWAASATGVSASETEATLKKDGFVDGYGKTWASSSTRKALVEAVMAFSGAQGAKKALTALEASDKADSHYTHADSITGINPYYGGHFVDSNNSTVEDLFVFAKGNDVFFVILASTKDDALTLATSQAKTQFESAPDSTIPSSQWPENAVSGSGAYQVGYAVGRIFSIAFIVGVVLLVVGLILRRRRRAAVPGYGAAAPATAVQLSPDGNYWWDGQAWRDASQEAPPVAQRSSDGNLWWDGRTWRPVPQPAQPPQPPTA